MAAKDRLLFICLTLTRRFTPVCLLCSAAGEESEATQDAPVPGKSSSGSTRDSGCHMPSDSSPEDGDLDLISQCSSAAYVTVTWQLEHQSPQSRWWWPDKAVTSTHKFTSRNCEVVVKDNHGAFLLLLTVANCFETEWKMTCWFSLM